MLYRQTRNDCRDGVGFPSLPAQPAGCAPFRVFKVKGNWTPASLSSWSVSGDSSRCRAQGTQTRPPPGPGVPKLTRPGRGRLTRSVTKAQRAQRRSASPYFTSERREATERGFGLRAQRAAQGYSYLYVRAAPPPPSPRSSADLRPPGTALPEPRPFRRCRRSESGRARAWMRGRGRSDPCWKSRLG